MVPRRLQKPWFGTAIWLALVYLSYRNIDTVAHLRSPGWALLAFTAAHGAFVLLITYAIVASSDKALTPVSAAPPPHPHLRASAYLVVHLDLKVDPPVALFVHTYSCSAKDLTHTGAHEARADLYMIEADTFQDALDEMERIQPLYFPWVTPLLTRKR